MLGKDPRTIRRWATLHEETGGDIGLPFIQVTPKLRMVSRAGLDGWLSASTTN